MLARLLAVADDVDAGVFLQFEGEQGGVVLAGGKLIALQAPGRPQFVRVRRATDGFGRLPAMVVGKSGVTRLVVMAGPGERSA